MGPAHRLPAATFTANRHFLPPPVLYSWVPLVTHARVPAHPHMELGPESAACPHTPATASDPHLQSPGSHCDPRTRTLHRVLALSPSHTRVLSSQSRPGEVELPTLTPAPHLPCKKPCLLAFAHPQAVGNYLLWLRVPAGAGTCHPLGGFAHCVHTFGSLWGLRGQLRPWAGHKYMSLPLASGSAALEVRED